MSYIDIRTNIIDSQKEQVLDIARALDVSLSEVVRIAVRRYLASDASKIVYMTYDQKHSMEWLCYDSGDYRYHRKSCHHIVKDAGGKGMTMRDVESAHPCQVCKP